MENYIKSHIENYAEKERVAVAIMEERSCSLRYAFPSFYDEITDKIEDYCEENGLDPDGYETEDVFFEL